MSAVIKLSDRQWSNRVEKLVRARAEKKAAAAAVKELEDDFKDGGFYQYLSRQHTVTVADKTRTKKHINWDRVADALGISQAVLEQVIDANSTILFTEYQSVTVTANKEDN